MHRVCLEANRYLDKYDAMAKEVNKLLGRIAPPAPVFNGEYGDAYQGAREDLSIWKRRALEADEHVRRLEQINDHMVKEAQGESRMGEPVIREPAPVVPEEATPENVEMLSGYVSTYKLTDSERDIAAEIWNACRAAMLQAGNFRENKGSSTNNFREISETSTNYPVTPDGWISCSERMPEDTKMLLAFSQGEIVAAYWNWVVNPIDYKKYRAFTYLSGNILDDVTHWMPLPEPPQEVNHG
ncbi:DUF551 domain-containing protein [Escherichia coli]|uniref:DUF551 domain-containing protein n=6 Tax=Escherichia coli TaxID=562 RepID=UPI000C1B9AC2|nr:DUF551 domain-containing protein [Escherichia coli]EER3655483.1 DUF551 domain-containing protein [Escherichia coli]EEV1008821.1 DUF551 domain-containing protein [Escherichia coli]EFE9932031.1 DUF551 domain-containing protein [Escherichia coli]EFL0829421.1 DUF551 domain-containing protein [Escherichia coli]EHU4198527.1 DUF551 domain-containing protein [Escherichia coli]